MSGSERRSLLAALATVGTVRLLLWALPYARVRGLLERTAAPRAKLGTPTPDRIATDVDRAARVIPRATCLVQALAAEWLLARQGSAATVRFGVARGDRGFEAHAWLESGGRVILGGATAARFAPLIAERRTAV